jgi:hypothetical protein
MSNAATVRNAKVTDSHK